MPWRSWRSAVTLAAALWAGEEEQALNSKPVSPTTASAPQARRYRTPKRFDFRHRWA